jgi:hypothetical protein
MKARVRTPTLQASDAAKPQVVGPWLDRNLDKHGRNLPLFLAGLLASRDSPTPLTSLHAFETKVKHWTFKMCGFRATKNFSIPTEESHEYDPRKLASGCARGSGRLGAGTRRWGKGTESKHE